MIPNGNDLKVILGDKQYQRLLKKRLRQVIRIRQAIAILQQAAQSGNLLDREDLGVDVLGRVRGALYLLEEAESIQVGNLKR